MHDHNSHDHAHGHLHAPASFGFAFALGTALNIGFVVVEAVFGVLSGSTALLADAGHNLSDVLGLLIAWGAAALSRRAPDGRYTYGLRGSSILAALFNAVFLLVAVGAIALEAAQRMFDPRPVGGATVMVVAAIGILVNGASALLFVSGRKHDINIQGAFLHMAADALVSAGVVIGGGVILLTGWLWVDPLVSLVICGVIVWSTWSLLRDAVRMSLAAVPPGIDAIAVRSFLAQRPGVAAVHDLHIWSMSTTETALTCHLVMPAGHPGDRFLRDTADALEHRFGICHATLQIELDAATVCALAPDTVV
jgi:cobalt-zinc-cadmium efflux system protein